ncbi:MAG: RNA methyltransferase [Planctomycetes bacterium]|nr:RNA methyltransferase [Planctomycetota bacterium]
MARYYAACTLGLEEVLAQELRDLGSPKVVVRRGACEFSADKAIAYKACLWLRSGIRVQEELARGRVQDREDLYALVQTVDWSESITHLQTIAIDGTVRDSCFNDTRFPVLVTKDAICDQLRDRTGRRPDVERDRPDLPLKLVLLGDEAILYRELGGEPLHKRGYRAIQHKSPLNEATAAGLLLLTGWDKNAPVCDPMCGSGTFLVEAAWIATDRAPGLGRSFAFERWKDVDLDAWRAIYDEAEARADKGMANMPRLCGNDRHAGALSIAQKAIAAAGLKHAIELSNYDARDYVPSRRPELVVTNPPYGDRLQDSPEELDASWHSLGTFLHERCQGAVAYVLCGAPELTRELRLRSSRKHPVRNGPIECRWLRYELGDAR